jgi:hypothetical protein
MLEPGAAICRPAAPSKKSINLTPCPSGVLVWGNKPDQWKGDIAQSVDMYNDWFIRFAPEAYRTTRVQTTKDVEATLKATKNLTDVGVELLKSNPSVLPSLRMSTCPPLAVDRLIGLAGVSGNLVKVMEKGQSRQGILPMATSGARRKLPR